MWDSIVNFLKGLFSSKTTVTIDPQPITSSQPLPTTPVSPKNATYDTIADMLVEEFEKLVGMDEIGSSNSGPVVSKIIKSEGGSVGEPYCTYTCSYVAHMVCNRLSMTYPEFLYEGGSSQSMFNQSLAKYRKTIPQKGYFGILTDIGDESHGHAFLCRGPVRSDGTYPTVEANLGNDTKNMENRTLKGTSSQKVKGFVDATGAIFDKYKLSQRV